MFEVIAPSTAFNVETSGWFSPSGHSVRYPASPGHHCRVENIALRRGREGTGAGLHVTVISPLNAPLPLRVSSTRHGVTVQRQPAVPARSEIAVDVHISWCCRWDKQRPRHPCPRARWPRWPRSSPSDRSAWNHGLARPAPHRQIAQRLPLEHHREVHRVSLRAAGNVATAFQHREVRAPVLPASDGPPRCPWACGFEHAARRQGKNSSAEPPAGCEVAVDIQRHVGRVADIDADRSHEFRRA